MSTLFFTTTTTTLLFHCIWDCVFYAFLSIIYAIFLLRTPVLCLGRYRKSRHIRAPVDVALLELVFHGTSFAFIQLKQVSGSPRKLRWRVLPGDAWRGGLSGEEDRAPVLRTFRAGTPTGSQPDQHPRAWCSTTGMLTHPGDGVPGGGRTHDAKIPLSRRFVAEVVYRLRDPRVESERSLGY